MHPFGDLRWEHVAEGFFIGLATATAAAVVAALVGALRALHRTEDRLKHEHHYLLHWARLAGRKIGLPFPLEDDNHGDEWDDEGLR